MRLFQWISTIFREFLEPMSERFHSGYLNSATSFENSVVEDINIFRPESHVAQQRRRDKLRNNQQIVSTTDHLQDIHNHLLQFPNHCRVNADPATLTGERNSDLVYDTAMFSSEMLNFPMPRHPLYARFKDSICSQETGGDHQSGRLVGLDDASLGSSSHVVSSSLAPSGRVPHYTGYWKGVGPAQQSSDWIVNYVSQAGENACSQNPLLVGECLPSTMKEPNLSSSSNYMKSGCNAYQDVNMASASTSQVYQKQCGDLNFNSTLHNALQTDNPRNLGSQGCEMARLVQQNMRGAGNSSWLDGESDSDIRPTYENVVHASRLCDPDRSMYRSVEGGNGKLGMGTSKSRLDGDNFVGDPSSRGLSLSLSSHPSPTVTVAHFGENFESENLLSRSGVIFNGLQDSKSNNSGHLYSYSKASVIRNGEGNSVQGGVASSAYTRRNIGPLGPFTGYATILKNSKFLKPAQQLLDEICLVNGSKHKKMSELSETGSREMSISSNAINLEDDACGKGGTSGFSSTSFNSSNEAVGEGGSGTGSSQPHRPRIQQKKAKLLFMQEEVCRRYKLYHQQMQMAVSSFESVVGLSSATPYTSLALKTVSRHFRTLKNAISDQLRNISKALGEDLLSPSSANSSKGDMDFSRFRCINQNLQKQKAGGNDSLSFLEPQQPIWRPQRGLPERAVTVLRAWLFEHFLHPYPTDTDKHMLASQTGLSRNQVSNWFINARVRVWKPMVEEMHMLETNGSTEMELNSMRNNQKLDSDIVGDMNDCSSSRQKIDQMSDKQPRCSSANDVHAEDGMNLEEWSKEKRSRIECHTTGVDGGLMGFLPYHHSGLGAVSLTLGLRHSTDQQQQQQQQQREHQLSRHYGGHMIHDFVG